MSHSLPLSSASRLMIAVAGLLLITGPVTKVSAQAALEVTAREAQTGEPVEGAVLQISNESTGFAAERRTDAQGKARLSGLSTGGSYIVTAAETEQFFEAATAPFTLRANHTRSVTIFLTSTSDFELDEVVVRGARSVSEVNRVNAEVSSSLSAQAVEDIPVEGRNFTQVLKRLPNVTPATGFFSEAPKVSINGANGLFANYMIDGMDNNENFLGGPQFELPTGMIQDITVLSSTYSAEFGRTGNGIFNVTTRSGGNDLTGEAFYQMRPGPALDSSSPFAQRDLSGNQVKDGFSRQQGGFSLGGPIQKDETFFFVNLEHTTDFKDNLLTVPELGINETIRGENHFTYLSGKLDHRWSDNLRSSLRANYNRVRVDRQGGGLEGGTRFASAADTQVRDGVHVALHNTYVRSNWMYEGNVQFSHFNWDFAQARNPGLPQVSMLAPDETNIGVIGNPGFVFDSNEYTIQANQKLRYETGNHNLAAGVDIISSDFSLAGGGNPNGNYLVRLTNEQLDALASRQPGQDLLPEDLQSLPGEIEVLNFGVETRPSTFGTRQNLIGAFVENEFSPTPNLTATTGLRWDYDSLSRGGASSGNFTNFAPRLSVNYALDDRSSLRAGYGIFYDKIVYAVFSDALQFSSDSEGFRNQIQELIDQGILPEDTDIDRVTSRGNLTANAPNPGATDFLGGPTPEELASERENLFSNELRILNPNGFDNPMTHQFSLGYQRELQQNTLFSIDLIHTRGFNEFRLRDLNASAPFSISREEVEEALADPDRDPSGLVRTQFEADESRRVDIFQRDEQGDVVRDDAGNPQFKDGVARQIMMTETAGESRYWAASVNLIRERGDGDFSYNFSYTLSSLRNNTDDINFRAQSANDFEAEWGPSVNDRRHVISGVVSYFPIENLRATVAGLLQSGQPINRIPDAEVFGTTDLNGDGRSFSQDFVGNSDRSPGESRNSDRLPWSTTFDLSVQYGIPITSGRVVVRADVFNVFNAENLSGFANNATQSNQIQAGPRDSRTFVQRNAGPPRQFQFGVRYEF